MNNQNKDVNRSYILRFRPYGSDEDQFIPIDNFDIFEYKCGLKEGDNLQRIVDIPIKDSEGNFTDEVHHSGEIWTVLSGSSQDPKTLWLRQPDGELHSWDDDKDIFNSFLKID